MATDERRARESRKKTNDLVWSFVAIFEFSRQNVKPQVFIGTQRQAQQRAQRERHIHVWHLNRQKLFAEITFRFASNTLLVHSFFWSLLLPHLSLSLCIWNGVLCQKWIFRKKDLVFNLFEPTTKYHIQLLVRSLVLHFFPLAHVLKCDFNRNGKHTQLLVVQQSFDALAVVSFVCFNFFFFKLKFFPLICYCLFASPLNIVCLYVIYGARRALWFKLPLFHSHMARNDNKPNCRLCAEWASMGNDSIEYSTTSAYIYSE